MKILRVKLYCILTTKQIYVTLCFKCLSQTPDETEQCEYGDAMYRSRGDKTGRVGVMQLRVNFAAHYQQFLDNKFKQYLTICCRCQTCLRLAGGPPTATCGKFYYMSYIIHIL
jgi:hypothetical protein